MTVPGGAEYARRSGEFMGSEKIAVAMSGGVDSSVAAAVLNEKGYDVIGLTMRLWFDPRFEETPEQSCCSVREVDDARRVADQLDIPHYTVNMKDVFREKVVDYFTEEYCQGRTPNPCVVCNRHIKFGVLLDKALSLGAVKLATGHYIRTGRDPARDRYFLKKGIDAGKDQSYMLYNLTQEQLSKTLFPLGELEKGEVREKAREKGLPVAEKSESQEVCFIPGNDYREFLRSQKCVFTPGPIVNTQGERLGEHSGLPFYTIGQRKGLGITSKEPLFVTDIRTPDNTLVVGGREEVFARGLIASGLNFIASDQPEEPVRVMARIRYRSTEAPSLLYPPDENGDARLVFDTPQSAVSPGQAAVFYLGEEVLGGGTITARIRDDS